MTICTTLMMTCTSLYERLTCSKGTATHCNTLQHTARHCNSVQRTATHRNVLQRTATHCNALQHPTTHCNTLQHPKTPCNTLQHPATPCNTLLSRELTFGTAEMISDNVELTFDNIYLLQFEFPVRAVLFLQHIQPALVKHI